MWLISSTGKVVGWKEDRVVAKKSVFEPIPLFTSSCAPGGILRVSIRKMEQLHKTNSRAAWNWRTPPVPCEPSEALRCEEKPLFIPAGTFSATVAKADQTNSKPEAKALLAAEILRVSKSPLL